MVGDWVDEGGNAKVHSSIRWAVNESFLIRTYSIEVDGEPSMDGTVFIGWDPQTGQIKSWVFDSEGGHGEGLWTRVAEDRWVVKAHGVTPRRPAQLGHADPHRRRQGLGEDQLDRPDHRRRDRARRHRRPDGPPAAVARCPDRQAGRNPEPTGPGAGHPEVTRRRREHAPASNRTRHQVLLARTPMYSSIDAIGGGAPDRPRNLEPGSMPSVAARAAAAAPAAAAAAAAAGGGGMARPAKPASVNRPAMGGGGMSRPNAGGMARPANPGT